MGTGGLATPEMGGRLRATASAGVPPRPPTKKTGCSASASYSGRHYTTPDAFSRRSGRRESDGDRCVRGSVVWFLNSLPAQAIAAAARVLTWFLRSRPDPSRPKPRARPTDFCSAPECGSAARGQPTFQLGPFMLWGLPCFKYFLPLDSFSRSKPMYPFSKPTKNCNLRV